MSRSLEDILRSRFSRFDRFDVMRWLVRGHKTINRAEQMSLLSLLAYTAVETDSPVEHIQDVFLRHFGITQIEGLRSDDYEDAVHYLMHFKEENLEGKMDQASVG